MMIQCRLGLLCQSSVICRVSFLNALHFSTGYQHFQRKLTDRFQHGQPRLLLSLVDSLDQALIYQLRYAVQYREREIAKNGAQFFDRIELTPMCEDGEAAKKSLF